MNKSFGPALFLNFDSYWVYTGVYPQDSHILASWVQRWERLSPSTFICYQSSCQPYKWKHHNLKSCYKLTLSSVWVYLTQNSKFILLKAVKVVTDVMFFLMIPALEHTRCSSVFSVDANLQPVCQKILKRPLWVWPDLFIYQTQTVESVLVSLWVFFLPPANFGWQSHCF